MNCDCISKFNALFAEHNGRLELNFMIDTKTGEMRETVRLSVEKINKHIRKRPPTVAPTFCPFCGVRYREAPRATQTDTKDTEARDA
jgi:hypothetical protein